MRELVQQQRDELYAAGHQNLNMALPAEVVDQIDDLKRGYRLRSRDAVVARIIRTCMATANPDTFTQRAAQPAKVVRRISPIVAGDVADYVRQVQLRFRGLAYGPVFEMILDRVTADQGAAVRPTTERPSEGFPARKHEPARVAEPA